MGDIYYWAGFKNKNLCQTYEEQLKTLLTGEYTNGANVEKLHNHNIYSLRINGKGRILFSFFPKNGKQNILVLEILENHEYDAFLKNNNFRKKNFLKRFIENEQDDFQVAFEDKDFEQCAELPIKKCETKKLRFTPVHANQDSFFIFDEDQNKVLNLNAREAAIIIEGPPGSGKTSVAVAAFKQSAAQGKKILYVTKSPYLVEKIKKEWEECPEFETEKVSVLSYKTLVDHLLNETTVGFSEGKSKYMQWFAAYIQKTGHQQKELFTLGQSELIYQEFRTISGYNKTEYTSEKGIGQKQCLFPEHNKRIWLFDAYESWIGNLKANNLKLCEFPDLTIAITENHHFDQVLVDESQDLSHGSLVFLQKLCPTANISYFIDPRQNLTDENPKSLFLGNFLRQLKNKTYVETVRLSTHYRCPALIMEFASKFNDLRIQLAPQNKSEAPIHKSETPGGAVYWLNPKDSDAVKLLQNMKDDVNVCVITQAAFVTEAKQQTGNLQVFTAEEIKGLEYESVILYRMLDSQLMSEINNLLNKNSNVAIKFDAPRCSIELTRCFVAATRATKVVYMVQEKTHHLRHVIPLFQPQQIANQSQSDISMPPSAAIHSTQEDWEAKAKMLWLNGNTAQAENILKIRFKENQKQLENWKAKNIPPELLETPAKTPSEAELATATQPNVGTQQSQGNSKKNKKESKKSSNAGDNTNNAPLKNPSVTNEAKMSKMCGELFQACETGNAKVVANLVKAGVNVNGCQPGIPYKVYPLHCAIKAGHTAVIEILLATKEINIHAKGLQSEITPLHYAVITKKLAIVEMLLAAGADVNTKDNTENTPLHEAAREGMLNFVETLLEVKNIQVDAQNSSGNTALHLAVKKPKNVDVVYRLLQAGAAPDLLDNHGNNALINACLTREIDIHIVDCILRENRKNMFKLASNLTEVKISYLRKILQPIKEKNIIEPEGKMLSEFFICLTKMTPATTPVSITTQQPDVLNHNILDSLIGSDVPGPIKTNAKSTVTFSPEAQQVATPANSAQLKTQIPKKAVFYDASNQIITPVSHGNSAASHYVWCVNRALDCSDDSECKNSFLSDMGKHKETAQLVKGTNMLSLVNLTGRKLRLYITGFKVPGVHRVQLVDEETPKVQSKFK